MRTRTKAIILGCILLFALVFVAANPQLNPIGSGSGWEIDYQLTEVRFNGVTYTQEFDDGTSASENNYAGGGGGGGRVLPKMMFIDAYQFEEDPDGEPHLEGIVWQGLAPAFYVVVSQWRRVNQHGAVLGYSATDPEQISHVIGDTTVYEYYYEFEIRGGTESDQFATTLGTQSAECGSIDATTRITVSLQETVFGPVDGFFQDATVVAYDHQILQLDSGLQWEITPTVDPVAAGFALEVQHRDETEHAYTCEVVIPFSMSSGLVGSLLNPDLLRYDVWVEYTVRFTILLEEPVDIGSQGAGGLTGGLAPRYGGFDWGLALLVLGIGVFVLIAFFIYIRFRKRN